MSQPDLSSPRTVRVGNDISGISAVASGDREAAIFAYLDPNWRILGVRHVASASVDRVEVPLRAVIADALGYDCVAVVMAHTHPSGDPAPSDADYALTRRVARMLDDIGVPLVDHLILAGESRTSFRLQGLL